MIILIKDDNPDPADELLKARAELLTSHRWILKERIKVAPNGSVDTFTSSSGSECYFDNTYAYLKDGKYIMDEGPAKCYPALLQEVHSTYSLSEGGKVINMPSTEKKHILELTSDQLIHLDSVRVATGGVFVVTYKYGKE